MQMGFPTFKGKINPKNNVDWVKAATLVEHISESLKKIGQSMQKLWIFKVLMLEPLDEETTRGYDVWVDNNTKKI